MTAGSSRPRSPRPTASDAWHRVRFVIEQARAWSDAGGRFLRDYLDWTRRQTGLTGRVAEVALDCHGRGPTRARRRADPDDPRRQGARVPDRHRLRAQLGARQAVSGACRCRGARTGRSCACATDLEGGRVRRPPGDRRADGRARADPPALRGVHPSPRPPGRLAPSRHRRRPAPAPTSWPTASPGPTTRPLSTASRSRSIPVPPGPAAPTCRARPDAARRRPRRVAGRARRAVLASRSTTRRRVRPRHWRPGRWPHPYQAAGRRGPLRSEDDRYAELVGPVPPGPGQAAGRPRPAGVAQGPVRHGRSAGPSTPSCRWSTCAPATASTTAPRPGRGRGHRRRARAHRRRWPARPSARPPCGRRRRRSTGARSTSGAASAGRCSRATSTSSTGGPDGLVVVDHKTDQVSDGRRGRRQARRLPPPARGLHAGARTGHRRDRGGRLPGVLLASRGPRGAGRRSAGRDDRGRGAAQRERLSVERSAVTRRTDAGSTPARCAGRA